MKQSPTRSPITLESGIAVASTLLTTHASRSVPSMATIAVAIFVRLAGGSGRRASSSKSTAPDAASTTIAAEAAISGAEVEPSGTGARATETREFSVMRTAPSPQRRISARGAPIRPPGKRSNQARLTKDGAPKT